MLQNQDQLSLPTVSYGDKSGFRALDPGAQFSRNACVLMLLVTELSMA